MKDCVLKKVLRAWVCFFIDIFLLFVKRDERVIVCSGWCGERFADNSRYIFLYLCQNKEQLALKHIVWLTRDKKIKRELQAAGFTVYLKGSLYSIYYHLRAGSFFYDQFSYDYYVFLTRKAKLINLWHGMPIKKFGRWNGKEWNLEDDYLLTCSNYGDETIGRAFIVKSGHQIHGMYPRNYFLVHDLSFLMNEEMEYLSLIDEQKQAGKKILFYLPTFRNSKLTFLGETDATVIHAFLRFLKEHDYFMIMKIHFAGFVNNKDEMPYLSDCLLNLSPMVDVYPFLKETDILITDYSSVLFDFLYLDRDIICFPYDLSDYQEKDQGLLIEYDKLPADKVYSLSDLSNNLLEKKSKRDTYEQERKLWLTRCFDGLTMEDTIKNSLNL